MYTYPDIDHGSIQSFHAPHIETNMQNHQQEQGQGIHTKH